MHNNKTKKCTNRKSGKYIVLCHGRRQCFYQTTSPFHQSLPVAIPERTKKCLFVFSPKKYIKGQSLCVQIFRNSDGISVSLTSSPLSSQNVHMTTPPGMENAVSGRDGQKAKLSHVKKPLNAFMLYMKDMRSKVVSECTLKESAAINQILGKRVMTFSRLLCCFFETSEGFCSLT